MKERTQWMTLGGTGMKVKERMNISMFCEMKRNMSKQSGVDSCVANLL